MLSRFPQFERTPPEHVLRGLRALDPDAELVYLGYGKWWLGRFVCDSRIRRSGENIKRSTLFSMEQRKGHMLHMDVLRLRIAELKLQGFQFTSEYNMKGTPDSAIVHDQRVMEWMYTNLSDEQQLDAFEADAEKARKDSRADLMDDARGRDAWRYLFTLSHYTGKTVTDAPKSGRVRHMTIH